MVQEPKDTDAVMGGEGMQDLPYLVIQTPDKSEKIILLQKTKVTIGRLDIPENDIVLPEYNGRITRIEHCVLERSFGDWILKDQSTNGTILKREGQLINVQQQNEHQIAINSGDVICIHGYELTFYDPKKTDPLKLKIPQTKSKVTTGFLYKLSQEILYKVENETREKFSVSPQINKMLRCMARKNLDNNSEATLCTYEELLCELFGEDEYGYTSSKINELAYDIRQLFKKNGGDSSLIETVKTRGYILHIDCEG